MSATRGKQMYLAVISDDDADMSVLGLCRGGEVYVAT